MLELEKPEYILEEKDTLDKIFKSIDKKNAFIFNAGAGAGKTFSLIESLKYICIKYGVEMGKNNQCIVCITYTNVAAKEIMNRLGNSSLVLVSTIHERVWSFIKNYQMELLEIHINNLNEQIIELRSKLLNDKEFSEYNKLGEEQKQAFYTKMSALKSVFYANYDKRAAEFRGTLINEMQDFSALLNNVSNFKKMVGILYKIHNYEECIEKIFRGEKGYKAISYNILNNTEQLHKMEIGHDTVLKYGLEMIKEYDLLKRVIIDRYPYILIDEYQDTSTPVIEMMQKLRDYSMAIGHPMLLGYYGDAMQNIYTDGIGDALLNPKNNFEIIDKRLNRRSFAEIIEVSNRIRKDRILQVSLYEDCVGGNVSFYVGSVEKVNSFIEKSVEKYKNTKDNPLHCFLLTNKNVASYTGFEKLYSFVEKTPYYKKKFTQLNSEFLSDELSKLGETPALLYKLIRIIDFGKDDNALITDMISKKIYSGMNISEMKKVIEEIKDIRGENLEELLQCITEKYITSDNVFLKQWLDEIFGSDILGEEGLKNYIIKKLYDGENLTQEETIFDVSIDEFLIWYAYLCKKQNNVVEYHTYHGTKGLEFQNVVIIMEKSFGRDNEFFERFFKFYNNEEQIDKKVYDKYCMAKNLLYVSVSRAIKTLDILYIDDITSCAEGIRKIFKTIKEYK